MKKEMLYLSTVAGDAAAVARDYGLGLEIAEYCTAWNMDEEFAVVDPAVKQKLEGISGCLLHGPYNELFPCAIDKKARALAAERYRQAIRLAKSYGAAKVIFHGGYNPWIYYPVWYVEQSVLFWREFLQEDPGVEIVLENVLEETPEMLLNIVKGVDSPRLRLCLDIGHVSAYSKIPVTGWLTAWAPWISHFHIHNNDGTRDQHAPLSRGKLPIRELLWQAESLCPRATYTLELTEAAASALWLKENDLL